MNIIVGSQSKVSNNSEKKNHPNYFKYKAPLFDWKIGKKLGIEGYEYNYGHGGWKSGIWGYLVNAHTERDIAVVNDNLLDHPEYVYRILKFNEQITPDELRNVIKTIRTTMIFSWLSILEVSDENNTFHLNVIVRCPDNDENKKTIHQCLKQSAEKFRNCIRTPKADRVYDIEGLLNYCLKCKVEVNEIKDYFKYKRVLMSENATRLQKVEYASDWYVVPKGQIRANLRATKDINETSKNLASLITCKIHVNNSSFSLSKSDKINESFSPSKSDNFIDGVLLIV